MYILKLLCPIPLIHSSLLSSAGRDLSLQHLFCTIIVHYGNLFAKSGLILQEYAGNSFSPLQIQDLHDEQTQHASRDSASFFSVAEAAPPIAGSMLLFPLLIVVSVLSSFSLLSQQVCCARA